ncbi:DUF1737 domain-containing protein [Octadecabacter sp. CECT 8868]|uniref:DUF1737 domain-containing protein n=1 Tax=Octadecabacter algicola TaxID=2909342 RepID=UPI00300D6FA3|nr:DUF1737 domain-containing protein [Octadecabacter algicola]
MTEYKILTQEDPEVLGKNVEAAIHDGWQPYGALSISPRGDGFRSAYSQAMVKYADRF